MTATGVPIFRAWRNALNGRKARLRRKAEAQAALPPKLAQELAAAVRDRNAALAQLAGDVVRAEFALEQKRIEQVRLIWDRFRTREASIRDRAKGYASLEVGA